MLLPNSQQPAKRRNIVLCRGYVQRPLLDNNHHQILINVQIIEINNVPCISFDGLNLTASNDKDNLHWTPIPRKIR
jgi:hypothetical protein